MWLPGLSKKISNMQKSVTKDLSVIVVDLFQGRSIEDGECINGD